jgi:hypothetical protein
MMALMDVRWEAAEKQYLLSHEEQHPTQRYRDHEKTFPAPVPGNRVAGLPEPFVV